jgi:predicted aspartyl protease
LPARSTTFAASRGVHLFRLVTTLGAVLLFAAHNVSAATEIPFKYADGMIWVKVSVVGCDSPLNFLLDSGAGASVLDLTVARRLGMKLGRPENVQGVGGHATAYRANDFVASAGSVSTPRSLLALDLSGVSAGMHQRIDGLLGADFFHGRIVQLDYAADKLRLLGRGELNTGAGEILPLAMRNDAMCVRVGVAGNPAEWMRIDTGCNRALEWVAAGAKAKMLLDTSVGISSGSARKVSADVQLGSHRLADVPVGVHTRQIFQGEAGLLGNGILSKFTVTIDVATGRLLLAKR